MATHTGETSARVRVCSSDMPGSPISSTRGEEEIVVDPVLLVAFRGWMRQQRGTCDATLYNYSLHLRDLLKNLGEDPCQFDAHKLRQFILDTSQRCGW